MPLILQDETTTMILSNVRTTFLLTFDNINPTKHLKLQVVNTKTANVVESFFFLKKCP